MSKRIISIILILTLAVSTGTLSVFAAAVNSPDGRELGITGIYQSLDLASVGDDDFAPDADEVADNMIEQAEQLPDSIDLRNYNSMKSPIRLSRTISPG